MRNLLQQTMFTVPNAQATAEFFKGVGVTLSPDFMNSVVVQFSDTFSIKAIGQVGEVQVAIKAVVKNTISGQEIMYFRIM